MNFTLRSPAGIPKLMLVALVALHTGALPVCAQTAQPTPSPTVSIFFKDGKSASAISIERSGDNIMATVPVGTTMAKMGYPAAAVTRIDFPEPSQLKATVELLLKGDNTAALTQIEPIIHYYESYKDVQGSWWAAGMRLKLAAYVNLHRDAGSLQSLIDDMVKAGASDPEAARMASVLQAANMDRKGEHEKAIAIYDDVIKASTNEETLAYAWANKGASLFALQQFDPALLAYLHVPVFYPEQKLLKPAVMLGTGKCYLRIENLPEAEKAFNELIEQFPATPEADAARTELKKLNKTPAATSPATTPTPTPAPPANP